MNHPSLTLYKIIGFNEQADILEPLAVDGVLTAHELEPVVFRRIMTGGHHGAALKAEMLDGKIQHRGRTDSDINDITARRQNAADKMRCKAFRCQAAVPSNRYGFPVLPLQKSAKGPADALCILFQDILAGNSPDIIFSEYSRIHTPSLDDG